MNHHFPRAYPTKAAQIKRLQWMLKQCRINGWAYLAALIEQQIKALE